MRQQRTHRQQGSKSRADEWREWAKDAPDDLKSAVRTVWAALGPVELIPNPPTPICKVCGSHNWARYGDGGSNICPPCKDTP